jgi:hypothetical protein
MGDERDMFAELGWEKEIRSLADPHIPVNLLPEFEFAAGNRSSDDYGPDSIFAVYTSMEVEDTGGVKTT